jgi:pimeloyl-ACP methyl ester carboxylesterase
MARVTVSGDNGIPVKLCYEVRGSGQPVILIHGWPLSSRSWEQQVPALVEDGYRVITYDAIVPFEVSGRRTAEAVDDSKLVLVKGAPSGLNITHAQIFNAEILAFLRS